LRRVYRIIYDKFCGTETSTEISLQITVKTINDSARPDSIIPILLVFRVYPRMTDNSVLLFTVTKRIETICKATKEIRYLYAKRYITNALVIRNSPNTIPTLELPIQSDIRVWRENKK
jgi:hypothetical protein